MLKDAAPQRPPLFERFGRLAEAVPYLSLGRWPTPVTRLAQFERRYGLSALYVKREDLNHAECGGSKLRGLEFLLADAARRGARTLITAGAAGSHHVKATAWHARRLGMDTVALVAAQPAAEYVRNNLLNGLRVGTRFVPINAASVGPRLVVEWMRARRRAGGRPYLIPPGGTSALACLGHVNAALELGRQIDEGVLPAPDVILVPLGSLGTAAGLAVGCRLAGLDCRLVGVVAYSRWYCTAGRWARLARRTLQGMRRRDDSVPPVAIHRRDLTVVGDALGDGYACPTAEATDVAREMEACGGPVLDRTYTAKTLAGGLRHIRERGRAGQTVLFWHTYQAVAAQEPVPGAREALPKSLRPYLDTAAAASP